MYDLKHSAGADVHKQQIVTVANPTLPVRWGPNPVSIVIIYIVPRAVERWLEPIANCDRAIIPVAIWCDVSAMTAAIPPQLTSVASQFVSVLSDFTPIVTYFATMWTMLLRHCCCRNSRSNNRCKENHTPHVQSPSRVDAGLADTTPGFPLKKTFHKYDE